MYPWFEPNDSNFGPSLSTTLTWTVFVATLEPGAVTDLFVNQIKLSGNIDNTNAMRYSGLSAHLSFEAEAIQKVGAESAILSEWGLEVKIDNNDVIQYVEE